MGKEYNEADNMHCRANPDWRGQVHNIFGTILACSDCISYVLKGECVALIWPWNFEYGHFSLKKYRCFTELVKNENKNKVIFSTVKKVV